jgi:MoaA/NifB/PqqE/SkfB family radical SAM enzyme
MGVPLRQKLAVAAYVFRKQLQRVEKFPLVLQIEPLFRCNLECAGCGKIQHPE